MSKWEGRTPEELPKAEHAHRAVVYKHRSDRYGSQKARQQGKLLQELRRRFKADIAKGRFNHRAEELKERLEDWNPAYEMALLAADPHVLPPVKAFALSDLLKYTHGHLTAPEILQAAGSGQIIVQIAPYAASLPKERAIDVTPAKRIEDKSEE